jgi:hypothetical protein
MFARYKSGWGGIDENSLPYRSHFGDLQIWHSMSPSSDLTNSDVREKIVGQMLDWYQQAQGETDRAVQLFYMGKMLHTVQDSYSESHVVRENGEIVQFQNYADQDGGQHGQADKISSEASLKASAAVLQLFKSGASANEVERYLRNEVFRIQADRADLPSGGTAPRFQRPPPMEPGGMPI